MAEALKQKEKDLKQKEDELQKYIIEADAYEKKIAEQKRLLQEEKAKFAEEQAKTNAELLQRSLEVNNQTQVRTTVVKGIIGSINEFSLKDDWSAWKDRLEQFFIANDVDDNKKVSLFITLIGSETYALLRNLCTPALPSEKGIDELYKIMSEHLQPAPDPITERYKFKGYRQKETESVKDFLASLKRMSIHCDFKENLEENIRDQFIWGLRSESIKRRVLGDKARTYERAVELATALEAADRDVAEMASGGDSLNHVVGRRAPAGKQKSGDDGKVRDGCYCCEKFGHFSRDCKFKTYKCNTCGRIGHLSAVCKSAGNSNNNVNRDVTIGKKGVGKPGGYQPAGQVNSDRQNYLQNENNVTAGSLDNFEDLLTIVENVNNIGARPFHKFVVVEGVAVRFEVDTGSPVTAVSESYLESAVALRGLHIGKTTRSFQSYQGDPLMPIGVMNVSVSHENQKHDLELFVMRGDNKTPILGRDWLTMLGIVKCSGSSIVINSLTNREGDVFSEFSDVFGDRIGNYSKGIFSLTLKENARPVFCKPRPVPYAMREKIEAEIKRLVGQGVLVHVPHSDWGTPIVPVLKSNGQIRVCGDFKVTLNPHLIIDKHPIPRVTDLLAKLDGGIIFSKLDLSQAYQQVSLDEKSQELTTLSTHLGLFKCKRLMYGVASAPGLFQREMEKILLGVDGVVVFFDDVLITGRTKEEHAERLKMVLRRFSDCNLTLRKSKCAIEVDKVSFLGFIISREGVTIDETRVKDIQEINTPQDVSELRSFLGLVNYYSRFIPNYATNVGALYNLLRGGVSWNWSKACDTAFKFVKDSLLSHQVLVHYSLNVPVKVTCDASPTGLGAVLTHVLPDGSVRPIAFASRTLSKAERGYSQLCKEAAGLVFGVSHFHQYIYGRRFILETDHKPLLHIFGPKKGLPQMAASQLQRWAVFLSGYDFDIKHIRGKDNAQADFLSRINRRELLRDDDCPGEYSYLNFVKEEVPLMNNDWIKGETDKDTILSRVRDFVLYGWPDSGELPNVFRPYRSRENELTVEDGCVMWGHRVVVPCKCREELLRELHGAHMGIVKMKAVARSYIWWPGVDAEIEAVAKSCKLCLENAPNAPRTPLQTRSWPDGPNRRIHVDFLGPVEGKMYLISVDAFSKWVDVREMRNITASETTRFFKDYFSTWGITNKVVSDNGPAFRAEELGEFFERNGVKHEKIPPYHPESNGEAENGVKTFKSKFTILLRENSKDDALLRYLMYYRSTPHCTTGVSPAELQYGRCLRTRLDLIRPNLRKKVEAQQATQKRYYHGNRKVELNVNDNVMARDYVTGKWRESVITGREIPVVFEVKTDDERMWRRHADQLKRYVPENETVRVPSVRMQSEVDTSVMRNDCNTVDVHANAKSYDCMPITPRVNENDSTQLEATMNSPKVSTTPALRRSARVSRPPSRLAY